MPVVRIATERDLPFLIHLQRKESNALGFITIEGLEARITRGRVFVATENDEPAAFALFDVVGRGATIHQTAAMYDARRRGLCLELSDMVRCAAGRRGASVVRLACASDLEANAFWRAAGFAQFGTREGGKSRHRSLQLYEAPAIAPVQGDLLIPGRLTSAALTLAEREGGAMRYLYGRPKSSARLDQRLLFVPA